MSADNQKPIDDTRVVAKRILKARARDSGTEKVLTLLIGTPYWTEEGSEAACPIALEGLHGRLSDVRGIDPLDALRNAVLMVDKLLEGAVADHELFWPDGEMYEP